MRHKLARTNAEAHLFMELHPCDICGEPQFQPEHAVIVVDGDLASQYAGTCPTCGVPRQFIFRIPAEPALPDEQSPSFGDARPSELLDAGEWLLVADRFSSGIPARPGPEMPEPERQRCRARLVRAAAAVTEASKFLPAGAVAVARDALWSDAGRQVYDRDPGRFHQRRLAVVHRTYLRLAQRYGAS